MSWAPAIALMFGIGYFALSLGDSSDVRRNASRVCASVWIAASIILSAVGR